MSCRYAIITLFCCWLMWLPTRAVAQLESPASVIREGQWLEVRGQFLGEGQFEAQRVDLIQPGRYQVLIGTVQSQHDEDSQIILLDQAVEILSKTSIDQLQADGLEGVRVKVEGYFRNENRFSAREISPRGAGRERIAGRVDRIRRTDGGVEFSIMSFTVLLTDNVLVRHQSGLADYSVSESLVQAIVDRGRDEDELFGEGVRILDNTIVSGQIQAVSLFEDEYDLRKPRQRDRLDAAASVRGRIVYQPSNKYFAMFELNYLRLWRDDEGDGRINNRNLNIGEAYIYAMSPFNNGLDLQLGRIDFDENREWVYDQNLDGPKLIWTGQNLRVEGSVTTTLSDGNLIDENATNAIFYLSNNNRKRHLAAYVVHRDFDWPLAEKRTHIGIQAMGDWLPDTESWLEIAYMKGESGPFDSRGWGFDIGSTWELSDRFALSGGFALGTGNDDSSATDHTFRQTGLQDNNDKFAGVTSFRYYGELSDPELANLEIATLGLTWQPIQGVSLDLVGHTYHQNELSRRLIDMEIGKRPNGRNSDLGEEFDLILGWRTNPKWDLEVVLAWFNPGKAFDDADDAYFGKLQFRYRP